MTKDVKMGLKYDKVLRDIYEEMTEKNRSVGLGSSWWGQYDLIMGPMFVTPKKSQFVESVEFLHSRGDVEDKYDQDLYNSFLNDFGTHYVSSAIVGGIARMFSFVEQEYSESKSRHFQKSQMSLSFEMEKAKLLDLDWKVEELSEKLDKEFLKNSNTKSYFTPVPVNNISVPWDNWLNETLVNPAIVNMTLRHISDLVYEKRYKYVRIHLEKTLNYYLKNGEYPTMIESDQKLAKLSSESEEIDWIPGLDLVGGGFDAATLSPKRNIFRRKDPKIWEHPISHMKWKVPSGFYVIDNPSSLKVFATRTFRNMTDFLMQTTFTTHEKSGGVLGFGAKTTNTHYQDIYHKYYEQRLDLLLLLRQIRWFSLSVPLIGVDLGDEFLDLVVNNLPKNYEENKEYFREVIRNYGTHFISDADLGGLMWIETWLHSCIFERFSESWVIENVKRNYYAVTNKKESEYHTKSVQKLQRYINSTFQVFKGGSEQLPLEKWKEWIPTLKYTPSAIEKTVVPLYDLFNKGSKHYVLLKRAISDYLQEAELEKQKKISEMSKVPYVEPAICRDQ